MGATTILIADDDAEIANLIALHLQKEGYRCICVHNGQEAVQAAQQHPIDLAALDIMMPHMDGYEATQLIREQFLFPIIFLSAKTSDLDKITGLIRGADDYMTKPFNPLELVARVKAQLRRFLSFGSPVPDSNQVVTAGGITVNPDQRTVKVHGKRVELTPKEFDILYLLVRHPKQVFRSEAIFKHVWGEAYYEGNNTVMVHIRTLRKKLGEAAQQNKWIRTVWGVGYTFDG